MHLTGRLDPDVARPTQSCKLGHIKRRALGLQEQTTALDVLAGKRYDNTASLCARGEKAKLAVAIEVSYIVGFI